MKGKNPMRNEKGIAVVLAVSLTALLALFGVWMIQQSLIANRITTAMKANEESFYLAEGAFQVCLQCLKDDPYYGLTKDLSLCNLDSPPSLQDKIKASIDYLGSEFATGEQLNKGAPHRFYYYGLQGEGETPGRDGQARSHVSAFVTLLK
jgi:hypothetical protein